MILLNSIDKLLFSVYTSIHRVSSLIFTQLSQLWSWLIKCVLYLWTSSSHPQHSLWLCNLWLFLHFITKTWSRSRTEFGSLALLPFTCTYLSSSHKLSYPSTYPVYLQDRLRSWNLMPTQLGYIINLVISDNRLPMDSVLVTIRLLWPLV